MRELQNSSTKELLPRSLDELNSVNSLHDIAHWHNSSVGTSSTTTTCWDFAAMVEGPGVHRVAVAHRRILQGRVGSLVFKLFGWLSSVCLCRSLFPEP